MTSLTFSLPDRNLLLRIAIPLGAVVASLLFSMLLIAISGRSVPDAIDAFLDGAFGTAFAFGASINRAVALALVGLGFIFASTEARRVGKEFVSSCRSRWSP